MLKFANRAEVRPEDRKSPEAKAPHGKGAERRDGRDGLKAALVRPPVVAAVDLGASNRR